MAHSLEPRIKAFIAEHRHDDPGELMLKAKTFPDVPIEFVARQIKGWQRIQKKLPTWSSNDAILYPSSLSLEQCSSERTAAYKASLVRGEIAADLTGGFGVDAFYLSRSFSQVYYVERDEELASIAKANFQVLGVEDRVTVINDDGVKWLNHFEGSLDLVYVDPARRDVRSLKVSALELCEPNILDTQSLIFGKASFLLLKASPGLDIDKAVQDLENVSEVHVVSVEGECKELLFLNGSDGKSEPSISCLNLQEESPLNPFRFARSEEKRLPYRCGPPRNYLYEPNASIMKAGAFKSVASAFGLDMLHPRTRIYTSDTLRSDFPGRVFRVEGSCSMNEKAARVLFPEGIANVASRNSGLTSYELKRKLKLRDGGDIFAVGVSLERGERRIFRCSRL